jgi:hypothetical protein
MSAFLVTPCHTGTTLVTGSRHYDAFETASDRRKSAAAAAHATRRASGGLVRPGSAIARPHPLESAPLDRNDPEERKKLAALQEAVRSITGDCIPQLEKMTRARLMLSYPWSPEEED